MVKEHQALYEITSNLKDELVRYAKDIEKINVDEATLIIKRAQEIRDLSENPTDPIDLKDWKDILETSERLILYLLARFPEEFLPNESEIDKIVNNTSNRIGEIDKLKQKFPYAVRITKHSHLYLDTLRQIDKMYDPDMKSIRPYYKNWDHEVGHFSRRLAINKSLPLNHRTEFIAIIYKNGDNLGYRPAVFQDHTNLSVSELVFLSAGDWKDMSRGDMLDVIQEGVLTPLKNLRVKIRNIFN